MTLRVCPACFCESAALAQRFREKGEIGDCDGCNTKNAQVIPAAELRDLFEAIKKFYNPLCGSNYSFGKLGGAQGLGLIDDPTLSESLRDYWEIFSDGVTDDRGEEILHEIWPGYLGAYRPIGFQTPTEAFASAWQGLKAALMHSCRFFPDRDDVVSVVEDRFDPYLSELGSIPDARSWRRARIQDSAGSRIIPENMGAPPPKLATAGRANPHGISFLYVASDIETAVAEVRAEPGDWVTVASANIDAANYKVLDLVKRPNLVDPFGVPDISAAQTVVELLITFSNELSTPVRSKDSALDYIATQFIAEYFRSNGFDGIIYPSAVASGMNAVFFDPSRVSIESPECFYIASKSLEIMTPRQHDERVFSRWTHNRF